MKKSFLSDRIWILSVCMSYGICKKEKKVDYQDERSSQEDWSLGWGVLVIQYLNDGITLSQCWVE